MENSTMNDANFKRWRWVVFVMAIGACVFAVCRTCLYRVPQSEEFVEFKAQFLKYMADVQNTSLEWDKRTSAAHEMFVQMSPLLKENQTLVSVRDIEKWIGPPIYVNKGMHQYLYSNTNGTREILLFFYEFRRGYIGYVNCIVTPEDCAPSAEERGEVELAK